MLPVAPPAVNEAVPLVEVDALWRDRKVGHKRIIEDFGRSHYMTPAVNTIANVLPQVVIHVAPARGISEEVLLVLDVC
ncbi:hypothetical protein [Ktedonobacter sp. SOSP1-52]|uniref:hypothetical protein n=1 Tax=Ktedonobacter sp. SOSP1-52 TaxID=2778366 RepID=UPI0019168ADC